MGALTTAKFKCNLPACVTEVMYNPRLRRSAAPTPRMILMHRGQNTGNSTLKLGGINFDQGSLSPSPP
jgi:hypothetical protein